MALEPVSARRHPARLFSPLARRRRCQQDVGGGRVGVPHSRPWLQPTSCWCRPLGDCGNPVRRRKDNQGNKQVITVTASVLLLLPLLPETWLLLRPPLLLRVL